MSDFKANRHHIRLPLGLQTLLGELTALRSDPLAGFKWPTSKEGEGTGEMEAIGREE